MIARDAGALLASLVGVLVLCAPAVGEEPAPGAPPRGEDTVHIEITAIEAAQVGGCDPSLQGLRSRLRRTVGYRSYRLVQKVQRDVVWQDSQEFLLPDGTELVLVPRGRVDRQVQLQVRLIGRQRRLVDTVVRLQNRGTMIFALEQPQQQGQALVIVLRAED